MSITITRIPSQYSFVGNSIIFELSATNADVVDVEVISSGESKLLSYYPFKSGNEYRVRMELSGYLYFEDKPLYVPMGTTVAPLSDFTIPYQVKIGEDYTFDGTAFRGGVSDSAYAKLADNGYDIFSYRLSSAFSQFLFTTRTNKTEIRIRETELFPFTFINHEVPLKFVSESGNFINVETEGLGPICVMDIFSLREIFTNEFGVTPQELSVYAGGEFSFKFIIIPGQISEEKYSLRFRNSLGAYEIIEVVGQAMHKAELADEVLYNTLTDFDFYEERRERIFSRSKIDVETGYKHRWEIPFVLDMIKSKEIYFISQDGQSFRCHVSTDAFQYQNRMSIPTSIPLTIREVVDEQFFSPEIDYESIGMGGIFDETFDDSFE